MAECENIYKLKEERRGDKEKWRDTAVQSMSLCLTRTQLRHERDLADKTATSVSGLMPHGNGYLL